MKLGKCVSCGAYTMHEKHCSRPASAAHPPKFSVQDKYAAYRRKSKYD
ncbi:TPA: ribosome biogenesis protein [Candidatus Micrarchaeota archaeon]|nr:ribosome biogenesis protein [Candidatus Micrarchaeota archaeon]